MKKTKQFLSSFLAINVLILNLAFIPVPTQAATASAPITMIAQDSFLDNYIINPVKNLFGIGDGGEETTDTTIESEDTAQPATKSASEIASLTAQITDAVYQDGKAYVEWERVKSDGFINYELERSINEFGWNNVATITDPALTFYNDQPGSSSNSIKYRVITNADLSYTSDAVYALDDAFKITKSEIDPTGAGYLEWSAPAQGAQGYTIYSSVNNAAYKTVKEVSGTWSYYRDESVIGQNNLNILQYKIKAKLADGSSVTSDPVTVLNQAPDVTINPNLTAATFYSEGYVSLQWTKPTQASGDVVYEIWRSTTGDYFYPVNQNVNQLYYLDNLGSYASYDTLAYKVLAVDQGQVGESNIMYAKDSSFELKSADLVGSFAYLEWSTPAQSVTGYEIYRTYDMYQEGVNPNLTKVASAASSHYYFQDNSVDTNQAYIAYQIKANISNFSPAYTAIEYVQAGGVRGADPTDVVNTGENSSSYPYSADYGNGAASTAMQIASGILSALIIGGGNYSPDSPADCNDATRVFGNQDIFPGDGAPGTNYDICQEVTRRNPKATLRDVIAEAVLREPNNVSVDGPGFDQETKNAHSRLKNTYDDAVSRGDINYYPEIGGGGIDDGGNILNPNGEPSGYQCVGSQVVDSSGQPTGQTCNPNTGTVTNPGAGGSGGSGGSGSDSGSGPGSASENVGAYKEFMTQFNPWEGKDSLVEVIGAIINLAIVMAGLIAVGFIVFGGYLYITSGGNPEKSKRATEAVTYAAIGLVVVLAAYLIVQTVLDVLGGTTSF